MATHRYRVAVHWVGDGSVPHSRDHEVTAPGTPPILASSDPAFRGDPARWNPEQLLVASLAQCHMLWYLHLAADAGVTVLDYHDEATGEMVEHPDGSGELTSVTLRPLVTVTPASDRTVALAVHERVPALCFITRSVRFAVRHEPVIRVAPPAV